MEKHSVSPNMDISHFIQNSPFNLFTSYPTCTIPT